MHVLQLSLHQTRFLASRAGSSFDKVVKTTILLVDMEDFGAVNEVTWHAFVNPPHDATCQVPRSRDSARQPCHLPRLHTVDVPRLWQPQCSLTPRTTEGHSPEKETISLFTSAAVIFLPP